MNLLKDPFISTTDGKVSLKDILTSNKDYQLQYFFDETQLAMLQMLSSLSTVVLKPTISDLNDYLANGLSPGQYDALLEKVDSQWFEGERFMRSAFPSKAKIADGPITKLVSGIECGGSANALGLFSESSEVSICCTDCTHVLNYNLHMNIKGECFGPTGATGIRGGGSISTLISGENLKSTILLNTVCIDYFNEQAQLDDDAESRFMWDIPPISDIYSAPKIGLERGLFALAYHIDFPVIDTPCTCDICGNTADQSVTTFQRVKYSGSYGSTKKGRDNGAGWWLHPYTPRNVKEDGIYAVCARDQYWQSWQELTSYVIGKETDKTSVKPAFIINQFQNKLGVDLCLSLLVGGNIADQGSIAGRVYDLYSMPSSLSKNNSRISLVINAGLTQKEKLSLAFNKIFGVGYDKNFVGGIKNQAIQKFTSNAQQIVQQILLDVNRKEATQLRKEAIEALNKEAKSIFKSVQRKYQHDLPLFKALVKGEFILYKADS
ncbi:type I-E CRISPR-associated protein Cse1/CasA [Pseudoalteromonas sp. SG43-7]|uniref:Type I-E CRISPR-associated protein Cse1/CasA n=1 Tax=Pseudoalteromonas neustonica TaxID=1840331 RepID=A0ABY3FH28_9GAMM|nr:MULTISPECIES: type I-E CRISPR-associated protein Cse1/CasA [Pseudoalteromonas]MBB1408034.1 type I-E CRISPR-associated protein Cse1/CasA [Pseudoalteromonas sp. SG44-17]MBB1471051.1 type I-E CRISPR-associated protein Cse1/CasA [Pseudoalteromonas sp. SG41-5]MBB1422212.1 type I-E CRISPR-associated protein Cse1/CasA [Pseudoalteromonas sp. SG43-7]MBB1480361.1 type I-E CRISPR-associated protein Cse1/CasA [Pseudoalteromonas sp. SG41-2]MBB1504399.1 type I-E CRISPR-associated protein Cse1/CasA [Pseud